MTGSEVRFFSAAPFSSYLIEAYRFFTTLPCHLVQIGGTVAKIARLVKRQENGIYYCRAAVPKHLIHLVGKREIKVSLGTADYHLARKLVILESARINQQFAQLMGEPAPHLPIQQAYVLPSQDKSSVSLCELIERYQATPERQNLSKSSKCDYESTYRVIKELLGEQTAINQISREKCRWFQGIIMQMPTHSTKRFPNASLLKAIELNKTKKIPTMSVFNVNKYVSRLSSLLEWACEESLLNQNPARGLLLNDPIQHKDKRDPFNTEQIRKIFSSAQMLKYKNECHPRYWVPLLALWTGARLNELCQLHVNDITKYEGILCLSISAGDGKQLKTTSATRIIPIHPELINQGFEEMVNKRSTQNHQRLFAELKNGSLGKPSEQVSKWFTRYLRAIDAKTDKTCFHSFRHNFRDALREAGADREVVQALGGWKDKAAGIEDNYGSKGISVQRLFDAISKIEYKK